MTARKLPASIAHAIAVGRREIAAADTILSQEDELPDRAVAVLRRLQHAMCRLVDLVDPAHTVPPARPTTPVADVLRSAAQSIAARPLSSRPEILDAIADAISPGGWPPKQGGERAALFARAVAVTARTAGVSAPADKLAAALDEWGNRRYSADVIEVIRSAARNAEAVTS